MRRRVLRLVYWTVVVIAFAMGLASQGCKEEREGLDLELGRTSYLAYCAACHGNEGRGDGPAAKMIAANHGVAPPSLGTDGSASNRSRKWLNEIIEKGGKHVGMSNMMAPWGDYLAPQVIRALADYVLLMSSEVEMPTQGTEAYMKAPKGGDPEGRRLYVLFCSSCHGPQGRGDGTVSIGPSGTIRSRDLTQKEHFSSKSNDDLYSAIALGGKHAGESAVMPGWTYELEPHQIDLLVDYVRAISGTAEPK